jgi:hypothetical protein
MSIFGNIMSSIFGHAKAQPAQTPAAAPGTTSGPVSSSASNKTPGATPASGSGANTAAAPAAAQAQVDVAAVLTDLASKNREKLDWRNSIVNLMKLLKLDSGLSARKELAKELN